MLLTLRSFLRKCTMPRHKKKCPHMVVAIKRWGQMRAWCRLLRGRLTIAYTHEPGQDGLSTRSRFESLVLTLDESEDAISPRERRKIREAVELVLLAVQVTPEDAWEQLVRVLCWAPDFFPANHLLAELEPRLRVHHTAYGTFQYDAIDVYEAMWADGARSKSYYRTRQWILSNASGQPSVKRIPLTLEITPTLVDTAHGSTQYLERAVAMLTKTRETDSPLRLESVSLDLRALDVDVKSCSVLREMQRTGIRIETLVFCPVFPAITAEESGLVAMLNDRMTPIESLVIDNSSGLAPPAVWNALRNARGLRDVEIVQSLKGTLQERRLVAQWQAFALLDPRSPTSVERVRFTEGLLSRTNVTTMHQILAHENPAELLGVVESAGTERTRNAMRLKLVHLPTAPASDDAVDEVIQLIACLGSHLETLAWGLDRWEVKPSHLHSLLAACPRLRRLRLQRTQLENIDGLLTHYQAGDCRSLESVAFEDSVILDRTSLVRFVAACNDRRSRIHRLLKDFVYDNYLHESVLTELLPIVERNMTLRHVGFRVTAFGMTRHRDMLKQLHLAPLAMQQEPLAIACMVAFLGATQSKLNSDVSRRIFEYAGEGMRRKVLCMVYDWIRLPNRFEI